MGACISLIEHQRGQRRAREHSEEIDRWLEEDHKRLKRECKVLLLGSETSGKDTILKQMKIDHQGGLREEELLEYRSAIYRTVVDCARSAIVYMRSTGIECKDPSNMPLMERILEYKFGSDGVSDFCLPPGLAEAIIRFFGDPVVTRILENYVSNAHRKESAEYFLKNILRISSSGYIPTEEDMLRVRKRKEGVTETLFSMGQLSIRVYDIGGQRAERKKWIHCFEAVTSIIFCTALSDYDYGGLLEHGSQNLMRETLILFDSVINSRWFTRTSIILLLTKLDELKVKLPQVPLSQYFEEYTGGADVNKAAKYILWKFMQVNRARLSVYPHVYTEFSIFICPTNTIIAPGYLEPLSHTPTLPPRVKRVLFYLLKDVHGRVSGRLSDFEYARESRQIGQSVSINAKTGIPYFKPIEIYSGMTLLNTRQPQTAYRTTYQRAKKENVDAVSPPTIPVSAPRHDLESLAVWTASWVVLDRIDYPPTELSIPIDLYNRINSKDTVSANNEPLNIVSIMNTIRVNSWDTHLHWLADPRDQRNLHDAYNIIYLCPCHLQKLALKAEGIRSKPQTP
ncbi:hypothetical protein NP233_g11344 [Leucocoprinus birnbaumii]|uniref:Uncharacterized protein n=1 Tax=Leucocoprinus birnbaumii TaxID=56174 RepID=A0AAD5VKF9_9AGAR|nr:hypothetical protein NP233_g11344 [Leucocoprinus birnbaumii]